MTNNSKAKKHRGAVLMLVGLLMIAFALSIVAYNFWDDNRAKGTSNTVIKQMHEMNVLAVNDGGEDPAFEEPTIPTETETPDYILNPSMDMPHVEIDGEYYIGTVSIPAIDLELPIIKEWSDEKSKIAPCRYMGSVYSDDLIIAAHNYRSHFGGIGNLSSGDEVTVTDIDGNVFTYHVVDMEIIDGADPDSMEAGNWNLTLFTCTLNGSTRITVRCE